MTSGNEKKKSLAGRSMRLAIKLLLLNVNIAVGSEAPDGRRAAQAQGLCENIPGNLREFTVCKLLPFTKYMVILQLCCVF